MAPTIGVPVKLLHEAEGHIVTVELVSGELYRGQLVETEDFMNIAMQNVTFTSRSGQISKLEHVYLRGSKVRFVVLPDMLKNAPMFKNLALKAQKGISSSRPAPPASSGRGGFRR